MRYLSLFSGIEAATVAWEPLGWEPMAFAEVDDFPAAVLANKYPNVQNLGDVRNVDWRKFVDDSGRPDVLIGGSPCQSFSVAGGRESLDGESRLMFEYIRACKEVRSPWILWENVPGVLNVRDGAFGQLLQELQGIGYVSLAWRILDAQFVRVAERDGDGRMVGWFGPVAQRRRRVFLVGHLGNDGGAAAVLFESESVSGNITTSGEKRKELVAAARSSAQGGCEPIAFKWYAGAGARTMPTYDDGSTPTCAVSDSHVPAVAVRTAQTGANGCGVSEEVAHTLDTTGPEAVAFAQNQRDELRLIGGDGEIASSINAQRWGNHKNETLLCVSSPATNAEVCDDSSPTLLSRQYKDPPYVVIDRAAYNQGENAQYDPYIEPSEVMPPLVARGPHAVGYESVSMDAEQSQGSMDESAPQSCEHESTIDFGEGGVVLSSGNDYVGTLCAKDGR